MLISFTTDIFWAMFPVFNYKPILDGATISHFVAIHGYDDDNDYDPVTDLNWIQTTDGVLSDEKQYTFEGWGQVLGMEPVSDGIAYYCITYDDYSVAIWLVDFHSETLT